MPGAEGACALGTPVPVPAVRGGGGVGEGRRAPSPAVRRGLWLSLPSCVGFFSPSLALDESLMIWGSEHSLTRNQPTLNRDNVILK